MARYESVLELIGNTPLLDVSSLSPNRRVQIFAKLEGVHGVFSVARVRGSSAMTTCLDQYFSATKDFPCKDA